MGAQILAMILLLGAGSPATPPQISAGKKMLAEAIDAAGGAKALDAIQDVTMSGSLTATMMDQDVDGSVIMIETRGGSTRDQMTLAGFDMISVSGPGGGFTSQAGISKTLAGNDLVQAQAQSKFTPLGLLLHGSEPGVVLRGLAQEDGLDVLEVDPPGADPLTFYFDPKTHLVTKLKIVSGTDGTTLISKYSLYKAEAGVQMPHQISLTQAGLAMVFTFSKIQVNTGVAPGLFSSGGHSAEKETAAAMPKPVEREVAMRASKDVAPEAETTLAIALSNHTGKTLNSFHFSKAGTRNWGEELLPVDKFHDGDTATIHFGAKSDCAFDMMITDVDGHYWVVPGADLCKHHTLTLRSDKKGLAFDAK